MLLSILIFIPFKKVNLCSMNIEIIKIVKLENTTYRDRKEPHSSSLPHHAAYGSVLRDSADQASSAPGERKPK